METPGAGAPQAPRSSAEAASRVDRRRYEDRGAEGEEGVRCREGCPPLHWERSLGYPSP